MSAPTPKPLPKALFDKAKKLKIKTVELSFSGGHDEGMLLINLKPDNRELENEFQTWAWKNFEHDHLVAGYGNGLDYEDKITYNISKKTVTTWGFTIEKLGKKKTQYTEKPEVEDKLELTE